MHPAIIGLSTVELARLIRQGDLRPSEVIEAHITRIEIVNPQLNAVVSPHFEQARREARAADARLQCGEPVGPLHGVPVTIKDAFDVAGAPATCGLTSRKRHIPETDASAVARLRLAGAIVLGKTNTPDNCWHQETVSALFGRTNNPWDLRRSPGGSTGGEAAIIAASGSPLGLGSDIAGSIRLPAAFCGIVGLRPTSGALDERGFWPPSEGRLGHLNAIGPMARRVEDVALAYAVLTGHIAQEPDATVLRGRILCSWLDDGLIPSSTAVQAGVQAATAALRDAGMRTRDVAPRRRRLAMAGWVAYLGAHERESLGVGFGGGAAASPFEELARSVFGRGRVAPGTLRSWLTSHITSQLTRLVGVDGVRWRAELRAEFYALVGGDGLALCPVFPTTAPHHGWSQFTALTSGYQTWVNLAGLPALVVPVGRSGNGLPVGVQIVGTPGSEETLLAAGLAVQTALMPHWAGPPAAPAISVSVGQM